jgi:hypothetical protein
VRTRYGQVRRRYAVPQDPRSPAQLLIRSAFGRVVSRWRGLTQDQRVAWAAATEGVQSRPRLAQSGQLSGYLLFIKINSALAYQGQEFVVTPPERPTFDANPVGALVVTNTGGVPDLKLSVPSAPAAPVLVLATGPCSAGVSFAKHFTIIGVLPRGSGVQQHHRPLCCQVRHPHGRDAHLHLHPASAQRVGRCSQTNDRHSPVVLI